MGKKIYLGGPSAELDLVIADAKKLEDAGHTLTEKWWERVHEARLLGYAHDAEVPDEYMSESAHRNETGLVDADAIVFRMRTRPTKVEQVLLAPGGPSGGLAYELGWIKGAQLWCESPRPVFIIGDPLRFIGIWTDPKPIRVASIEDVIKELRT